MNKERLSKRFKASSKGYDDGASLAHNFPNSSITTVLVKAENGAKLIFNSNLERALAYSAAFVAGYFIGIIDEYSTKTTEADGIGPTG